MSSTAADVPPPSDNSSRHGNILVHHSRDTAEKQWAETRVLTLAGVARVFSTRKHVLKNLKEYPRAWALLLEMIEAGALSRNSEVSLNSLKSFQDIAYDQSDSSDEKDIKESKSKTKKSGLIRIQIKPIKFIEIPEEDLDLWTQAWRVWQNIGNVAMSSEYLIRVVKDKSGTIKAQPSYPTQSYLTALISVFPPLLGRIYERFGIGDLQRLCKILQKSIAMPVASDTSPFLVPSFSEASLSSLQQIVLHSINILREPVSRFNSKSILDHSSKNMYPTLFKLLLTFVEYACCPPRLETADTTDVRVGKLKHGGWIVTNYVPFSEKCLAITTELYKVCFKQEAVVQEKVLESFIKVSFCIVMLKDLSYFADVNSWFAMTSSRL